MKEFKRLDFPILREYYTKYPHGYTIYESLLDILEHINEMTDVVNLTLIQWETIETWVLDELKNYSIDQLQTWLDNGTLEEVINEALFERINALSLDVNDRGVNLLSLGFVLDGVTDETSKFQQAYQTYRNLIIPAGKTLAISDTIRLDLHHSSLRGSVPLYYGTTLTPSIKWIGENSPRKTMVQFGRNAVGEEPLNDITNTVLENIVLDGDDKVGFGVYGTYVTNQSTVRRVSVMNTLEYGFYFAKSWHAEFESLFAFKNNNVGLAFGIPLKYLDGSSVEWGSSSALQINATTIKNIITRQNGRYFRENAGLFNLTTNREYGYGFGFGNGYSLVVEGLTSETNGGAGLFIANILPHHSRVIRNVYLENNSNNSGLDDTSKISILYKKTHTSINNFVLENVYNNPNSGGIYLDCEFESHPVLDIINMRGGGFFGSFGNLTDKEMNQMVSKKGVGIFAGYYSLSAKDMKPIITRKVDTRNSFEIELPYGMRGYFNVFVKSNTENQYGSLVFSDENGNSLGSSALSGGLDTDFKHIRSLSSANFAKVMKGGATGEIASSLTILVTWSPMLVY